MKRKILTLAILTIMVTMAFGLMVSVNANSGGGPRAARWGPDSYGYTADYAPFNWIEIRYTGRYIYLSDDSYTSGIPMGFDFEYYGRIYNRINVHSNGWLSFRLSYWWYNWWYPSTVPRNDGYYGPIALFARDLVPYYGGARYQTMGTAPNRMFIVEFFNYHNYWYGRPKTMEAIFYEGTNNIKFQYLVAPDDPSGIGIEDPYNGWDGIGDGGSWGANCYMSPSVVNPYVAIEFTPFKPIPAVTRTEPQSLNLESMGNYVSFKVEDFPDNPEYSPLDVDPNQCSVAGVGADLKYATFNDNKYIGKADRLLVEDAIGAPGDEVEVEIFGYLNDGTAFKGVATIKAL
jgi:hypothetical protein